MKNEPLHNMLDAVLSGSENNAQMHFHNYLKDNFRKMLGKGIQSDQGEPVKTELKETDSKK